MSLNSASLWTILTSLGSNLKRSQSVSEHPELFLFCYPESPTISAIEYQARYLFPLKLQLTQPTTTIATATTMYKASTFRLRSYKAYIRMINIPTSGRKYNQ